MNPEYGVGEYDGISEVRDTNDTYYYSAEPGDDITITDRNDYYYQ